MISKLGEFVTAQSLVNFMVLAILVGYFIYREWPEFKKRVSRGAVKEKADEQAEQTIGQRLGSIEREVKQINEKLDRDYKRINILETRIDKTEEVQDSTSEELRIIIEALLGALGGLQELGANGPTKEAEEVIHNYLNKKAHKVESHADA